MLFRWPYTVCRAQQQQQKGEKKHLEDDLGEEQVRLHSLSNCRSTLQQPVLLGS